MSSTRSLFCFLAILLSLDSAIATHLYVSPSGDDSNSGTLSSPLATAHRAVELASPGDVIELRAGTYQLSTRLRIEKNDLTVRGYANEKATLISPIDDANVPATVFFSDHVVGGRLEGLEIQGGYFYAVMMTGDIAIPRGASGITILDCVIHDSGRELYQMLGLFYQHNGRTVHDLPQRAERQYQCRGY